MDRTRIGIVFGGCSEEHAVSVKSAREVARHLDRARFEPVFLGITLDGAWSWCDGPEDGWELRGRPVVLSPDRTVHGLLVPGQHSDRYESLRLDVVFPVLHGTSGEDGAIQGLLELAGIPYVGCDIQSSALCMDKSLAYVVCSAAGISTPTFRVVTSEDVGVGDLSGLEYPLYVKPARSGSSFGVTRVEHGGELSGALAAARTYDSKVVIEQAVVGTEVGCAVLGRGTELSVGCLDQISLSHGLFRIHQEDDPEHGSENSTVTVPADIPEETEQLVRETALAIYRALGCRGLARVDMFVTPDGDVVLNEVNTLPGLTSYSRYPRMMAAAGWSLGDVIERLVALAMADGSS